jgi:hypothetical protein
MKKSQQWRRLDKGCSGSVSTSHMNKTQLKQEQYQGKKTVLLKGKYFSLDRSLPKTTGAAGSSNWTIGAGSWFK